MTECPNEERLAEFIDGTLSPDDRQSVVFHLADCATCYAVVSDSLTIREELGRRSDARTRRFLAYAVPSALAAAAVLLLVFRIWQPAGEQLTAPAPVLANRTEPARLAPPAKADGKRVPAPSPRSFAGDLVARLMSTSRSGIPDRPEETPPRPLTSFGFSSSVTPDKAAFRIGMCLTRIEVAREKKDQKKADVAARQLADLLKMLGPSSGISHPVAAHEEPDRYAGYSASLEMQYGARKELVYLKLGAWVEAAGRAADANDAAFFSPAEVRAFVSELQARNEPVGTVNDISKLASIISSSEIRPDQFRTITQLLTDIREMF